MLFLFFPVSSHTHTNTYSTRVTHPPPASTSRFSNYLGLHVFWSVSRGVGAARLDAGNVQGVPLWLPELVERRRRCRDDGKLFSCDDLSALATVLLPEPPSFRKCSVFLWDSRRSLATLAPIHSVGNTWLIRDEANSMEHTTGLLVVHRSP